MPSITALKKDKQPGELIFVGEFQNKTRFRCLNFAAFSDMAIKLEGQNGQILFATR